MNCLFCLSPDTESEVSHKTRVFRDRNNLTEEYDKTKFRLIKYVKI